MLHEIENIQRLIQRIKKKTFDPIVKKPLSNLEINFLDEFSKELKKIEKIFDYPDLVYLIFWCRKKKIETLKLKNFDDDNRLGRGVIFHICPSNIPTNFIYSFFFGLLSGNSNIVKMPSRGSKQKEIILKVINILFKKKKYSLIKNNNYFIEYDYIVNVDLTHQISSIADGRIVWGSDKTVNDIKKIWSPERSIDIMLSDRYSLSVLNLDKLKKLKFEQIKMLANKFYYDAYSMNQQGCNSPHFLFWIGLKNKKIQSNFWEALSIIIEKKYNFKEIQIVDKYSKLIENILDRNDIKNIERKKNNIYILDYKDQKKKIENIRGVNGIFYQLNLNNLNQLSKFITKKCQTMSYFGFKKNELQNFVYKNNLSGIDRIVPIGKALDIDFNWDGYDLIRSLSRLVTII